jgi:hypothetical protein
MSSLKRTNAIRTLCNSPVASMQLAESGSFGVLLAKALGNCPPLLASEPLCFERLGSAFHEDACERTSSVSF